MKWFLKALSQYADFKGRARRKEYWMFFLFNVIIAFALGFVGGMLKTRVLSSLYSIAVLVPAIAVGVRRMHDTDHSGWWLLLPIVNLVFACTDGTPGPNKIRPKPEVGRSIAVDNRLITSNQLGPGKRRQLRRSTEHLVIV